MASHQESGRSDVSLSVFSPSGNLQQLAGARAAVSSGAPAVGIVACSGVVIATANELQSPLFEVGSVHRVEIISESIGMVFSGNDADYRLLVKEARKTVQIHLVKYQQPIPVRLLVSKLGGILQSYTQASVFRPFGVSLLICGWGQGRPFLRQCDPSGASAACLATATGKHAAENKTFLEEGYGEGLELKDAVPMALRALKNRFQGKFTAEKIEVGVCDKEGFRRLSVDEIKAYLKKIR